MDADATDNQSGRAALERPRPDTTEVPVMPHQPATNDPALSALSAVAEFLADVDLSDHDALRDRIAWLQGVLPRDVTRFDAAVLPRILDRARTGETHG